MQFSTQLLLSILSFVGAFLLGMHCKRQLGTIKEQSSRYGVEVLMTKLFFTFVLICIGVVIWFV